MIRNLRAAMLLLVTLAAGCARAPASGDPVSPNIDPGTTDRPDVVLAPDTAAKPGAPIDVDAAAPVAPPAMAFERGWMPLAATGVVDFLRANPTYDGRGVLIAILDSGIDAAIQGLTTTSDGKRKILDLRDFSGEGRVVLTRIVPQGDSATVAGGTVRGIGRVASVAAGALWGGALLERPLGTAPAADVDGDGAVGDTLRIVVTRASDGWVLFTDTDRDGTLDDERPVHDYLVAYETFGWRAGRQSPLAVAANFSDSAGTPRLDLFFDTSGHGSHVAGIATANEMYGVAGFDGVAPGAQLLGLKIANNAQGGISTTGSMARALAYAIAFARERRLPLVANMSFGVGNERERAARIDQIIDSVLARNPDVVFTISAGNDGPGLSTVGFPGSASRIITVGATFPRAFLPPSPGAREATDPVAYFSSRGGELAKPDIVTPGVAYSTVPRWKVGGEHEGGTSMASPHAAGLAALLVSAATQARRPADAAAIRRALMVTAEPVPGSTTLDDGAGVPNVGRAWRWLGQARAASSLEVVAAGPPADGSAAYQVVAAGRPVPATQTFRVGAAGGQRATYRLRSGAPWIAAPATITAGGAAGPATVELRYDTAAIRTPGVYTGVVTGWSADTTAGPAFRLVTTVVVAYGAGQEIARQVSVDGSRVERIVFAVDSARPFEVRVERTSGAGAVAYLHEPGGMPWREESNLPAGAGEDAAVFRVDARDAVAGTWELALVSPTSEPASASVRLAHAPAALSVERGRDGVVAKLSARDTAAVPARLGFLLAGAQRTHTVVAVGSDVQRVPFVVPAWARGAAIDVDMAPADWPRFTDFGVTLFDAAGAPIETSPLNYASGRAHVSFPDGHGALPVELGLFPGFADPSGDQKWTARVTIRLYADTAAALPPVAGAAPVAVTVPARGEIATTFTMIESPWPLGDGFIPLGVLVTQLAGRVWTREAGLAAPTPPVMR